MSANSASCKTWCVTIVAAILVLIADKGKPNLVWLAVLPIVLFGALDVYYLHLEKGFRASYNDFITKVHHHALKPSDLFSLSPTSFAFWGFYIPLLILAGLTIALVQPDKADARQTNQVPASRYQHYR